MDHLLNCIHDKKPLTSSRDQACYSGLLKEMLVGGK